MKRILIVPFLALTTIAGCTWVAPVTTEMSKPTISFTQTGVGAINHLSYPPGSSMPVFFNTIATDPGGVKTLSLVFDSAVQSCTSGGGTITSGGGAFAYMPVPASQTTSPPPNAMGQVSTEVFLVSTLQGPYTCMGNTGPGFITGNTVNATATAINYSGQVNQAQLPITFQ